jgi:hypothetical protein
MTAEKKGKHSPDTAGRGSEPLRDFEQQKVQFFVGFSEVCDIDRSGLFCSVPFRSAFAADCVPLSILSVGLEIFRPDCECPAWLFPVPGLWARPFLPVITSSSKRN